MEQNKQTTLNLKIKFANTNDPFSGEALKSVIDDYYYIEINYSHHLTCSR